MTPKGKLFEAVLSGPDLDKVRALFQYSQAKAQEAAMAQAGLADFFFRLSVQYGVKEPVGVTPEGKLVHMVGGQSPQEPAVEPPKDGLNRAERRRLEKVTKNLKGEG